ncbi:MAG: hypothetical protein VKJ85_03280 [Prochlorothrix sp.]|nr:hypothetical protein [Prochlorothrix sp.]
MGFGVGDPIETVGFQVGLGFVDLSDPTADGTVSLKLHRQMPHDLSLAVGATGVLTWGGPDGGSSVYGVATKRFQTREDASQPFSQVTTTLGLGSGQYRSEEAVNNDRDEVGVFSSVAVRVVQPVSGIVEWTGQDMSLGISITPIPQIPLVITPAVTDVTGSAGDGARFILGVGYGLSF